MYIATHEVNNLVHKVFAVCVSQKQQVKISKHDYLSCSLSVYSVHSMPKILTKIHFL